MIDTIRKILGMGNKVDLAALVADGAVILDVRTRGEYGAGHIRGSVNVPIGDIKEEVPKKFKYHNRHIVTCCASGVRSALAKAELESLGYTNVHNGGGWANLLDTMNRTKGKHAA